MPRHITQLMHARVRPSRGAVKDRPYGASWHEMARYLSTKWGVDINDTRAMMRDIFRYIEMEVLAGEGAFTVPRFGRFERREVIHGEGEEDVVTTTTVMRFTRRNVKPGNSFIDWEDEEWEDP